MRARLLRPGFFSNELLAQLPARARLLFAGLWGLADREGRLEDRPMRIKAAVFPYERVNVEPLLAALTRAGFVRRYIVGGTRCLEVVTFATHQRPHHREPESELPPPPEKGEAEPRPRPPDPVTRSGVGKDQDQELTASRSTPFKVYAAIASSVLARTADLGLDPGTLAEELKRACAKQAIPYHAGIIQKALDAAQSARARRRA